MAMLCRKGIVVSFPARMAPIDCAKTSVRKTYVMNLTQSAIDFVKPLAEATIPDRWYIWMWSLRKPDRRYMEKTLLPAFARSAPKRVLNVGTQIYCRHYETIFAKAGSEFWTMDIAPEAAEFGAPGRHVVGSVVQADQYFKPNYFDLILLNGVFGFGVNEKNDRTQTLAALRKLIRPGGVLLVGWNNDKTEDDVVALARATGFHYGNPLGLPPRMAFENRHVYDLFTAE
jgi:hypothetical protein